VQDYSGWTISDMRGAIRYSAEFLRETVAAPFGQACG
jgi:hypothetical protein